LKTLDIVPLTPDMSTDHFHPDLALLTELAGTIERGKRYRDRLRVERRAKTYDASFRAGARASKRPAERSATDDNEASHAVRP